MGSVARINEYFTEFTILLSNFLRRNFYTTEASLVLHKCFAKQTMLKCGGLADFSTPVYQPCMHICTHAHLCSLFKTGRKTNRFG